MKKIKIHHLVNFTGIYPAFLLVLIIVFSGVFLAGCCFDLQKGLNSIVSSTDTQGQSDQSTEEKKQAQDSSSATSDTSSDDTDQTTDLQVLSAQIKEDFDIMKDGGAGAAELFDFIDRNMKSTDKDTVTYMVGEVIILSEDQKFDFTDKFTADNIQQKIYSELQNSYEPDMEVLKQTNDPALKALIDETVARKYKVLSTEGFFLPVVDYAAYEVYYDYISDELIAYIEIYLDESTRPAVLDAGIVIGMDEFVKRIDKAFKYLDDYPDSPRYEKVNDFNRGRLQVYLGGIDNTMVFDASDNIYNDRLSEFEDFAQDYEGTKLGDILRSYLDLLDQEGYKKTSAVEEFLQNL